MELSNLKRANLLRFIWIQREQSQLPTLAEHNQFAIGQNRRTPAVNRRLKRAMRLPMFIPTPSHPPGLELNTAESRIRLISAAESVHISVVQHRRIPVHFENRRHEPSGYR